MREVCFASEVPCGVRNVEEAIENCAAFDWVLTEQELAIIDTKLKELNI